MTRVRYLLTIIFIGLCTFVVAAADTEFTYQGELKENGQATNGSFDFEFMLWDSPTSGNQVSLPVFINDVQVLDGLFTVELDYGADAFDNSDRWLEIVVEGVTLSPRQSITRTPYSIQTRGIVVDENNHVGIGTSNPGYPLHVRSDVGSTIVGVNDSEGGNGRGVFGWATASTGPSAGVVGTSGSTSGTGVRGNAIADTGTTNGVHGQSFSTGGRGVFGQAHSSTGTTCGVYGQSDSASGYGVYGEANANAGFTRGVYGTSESTSGFGVVGNANATTGNTFGVHGQSLSTSGRGVFGRALAISGTTYGGRFENHSTSGCGVYGKAYTTSGITYGGWFESSSTVGRGVLGYAIANSGVNYGVVGHSNSSSGYDFWASGAGTNYGSNSSRRWKNNVEPIGDPLLKLARLRGVYFDWDDEHGGHHDVGMIAEEVGAVMPEIVQYEENGVDAIGMDYSMMTPLLVEAVNALRTENEALRDRLESLERVVERQANDEKETSK